MTAPAPTLIARYRAGGAIHFGRRERDGYVRLTGPPWMSGRDTQRFDPAASVELLAPVAPGKIVCIGLNYRAHIAESASLTPGAAASDEPLLFLKPPSSVIGPGQPIRYPPGVERLDPEAELAVVIGCRVRHADEATARAAISGLTCFNDVSARDYQRRDGQWTRAKGFDSFAPLGPWVAVGLDTHGLDVICRVNGALRQRGNTADLLFGVPFLIRYISRIMTLEPGDVIATGTPAGVAPIRIGDRVEVEVEGVGVLENPVEAAER
jgi:2-keto-4-pentenoate hydratase/2-oxohepta-3-ene-1,7-dioic acid hydratase in catechol pathway